MFPLHEAKEKGSYLKNFFWLEEQRPKDEKDVFTYYPKTDRLKPAAGSSSPPLQEP